MVLSFVLQLAFLLPSLAIRILLRLQGRNDLIGEGFLFPFSQHQLFPCSSNGILLLFKVFFIVKNFKHTFREIIFHKTPGTHRLVL